MQFKVISSRVSHHSHRKGLETQEIKKSDWCQWVEGKCILTQFCISPQSLTGIFLGNNICKDNKLPAGTGRYLPFWLAQIHSYAQQGGKDYFSLLIFFPSSRHSLNMYKREGCQVVYKKISHDLSQNYQSKCPQAVGIFWCGYDSENCDSAPSLCWSECQNEYLRRSPILGCTESSHWVPDMRNHPVSVSITLPRHR